MATQPQWTRSRAKAVTGGPITLYTISGGPVQLWALFGQVSTVIGASATTVNLNTNPTTGADTALTTASAITSAPVGSLVSATGR